MGSIQDKKSEVLRLFDEGMAINAIARQLGVSKGSLHRAAVIWGMQTERHRNRRPNTNCLHCGTKLLKKDQRKFCSRNCAASLNNIGKRRNFREYDTTVSKAKRDAEKTAEREARRIERERERAEKIRFSCCGTCSKTIKFGRKFCSIECRWGDQSPKAKLKRKRLKTLLAVRRYQASKLAQTPPDANHDIIRKIYENCPQGYEVDHRIPISKGGLHHQDNLQYLPISENRRKGNKLDYGPVAEVVLAADF